LAANQIAGIRKQLLRWYDGHRRDLPWRRTNDPYRIWVAEVMLQQTRVQAVIPYYERFLGAFPNLERLAAAQEYELLACWSGLGYYSRARNLQKAAEIIVRKHGGIFPNDVSAVRELPGVGRYTASAVLSIAYGAPFAVVDGNVARVLSRLCAISADIRSTSGKEVLWQRADELLPSDRPGDFNQAMMELGATICLPQQPRCTGCPLSRFCIANIRGDVSRYPARRSQPPSVSHSYVAAVVWDKKRRVLLVKRSSDHRWMRGFWELPMWRFGTKPPVSGLILRERAGMVRHSITTNRLLIAVHRAVLRNGRTGAEARWISADELQQEPVTTITRKAVRLCPAPA
jgi:A/G-specific adenine glycosylase